MSDAKYGSEVQTIKVRARNQEKLEVYKGTDWRKAFNRYLDGVWSQNNHSAEGILIIENVVISLSERNYTITNPTSLEVFARPTSFMRSQIHVVTGERNDFELGLARFLRNNHLQMFVAEFSCSRVVLWKGVARTELHFTLPDRTF